MLADALGDLYSFDSRLWRSLVTLALKPGRLTSLYLEGQRARFTPPFRMYVVTSLVFFVAFSLVRSMTPPNERQRGGRSGQRHRGGTVGCGRGAGAGCRYGGRGGRCSRHRRRRRVELQPHRPRCSRASAAAPGRGLRRARRGQHVIRPSVRRQRPRDDAGVHSDRCGDHASVSICSRAASTSSTCCFSCTCTRFSF